MTGSWIMEIGRGNDICFLAPSRVRVFLINVPGAGLKPMSSMLSMQRC